jgi:hypothetical protein
MKTNFKKNLFNMNGRQLQKLASRLQKKFTKAKDPNWEYTPIQTLRHDKLIPMARQVVCDFGVDGASVRTNKKGENFIWIQAGSLAEEIVNKLVHIHPYNHNSTEEWKNRAVNEALWILQFLSDNELCPSWEEIEDPKGFKFDPITMLKTTDFKVVVPNVDSSIKELYKSNGIYLNTIGLTKEFFVLVHDNLTEEEMDLYLNYLNGDPNKSEESQEDEGAEGREVHVTTQTESPEVAEETEVEPETAEPVAEETAEVTNPANENETN